MSSSVGPDIITNGIILHLDAADRKSYPGSGTVWTDRSGNGNNGTFVNGVIYNNNNLGTFSFGGSNYINTSSNAIASLSGTLCFWIKSNNIRDIYNTHSGSWNQNSLFGDGSLLKLRISNGSSGTPDLTIDASLVFDNKFHFICTTWTTGGERAIWIDSVKINSLSSTPQCTPGSNLEIGYKSWANITYIGNMFSIISYNRALTTEEIKQNFNATKSRFGLL
jgi:hypothetical protein